MNFNRINEQDVHVEDALDMATLGKKTLNFLMDKKLFYQMMVWDKFTEDYISHKGNKNIFDWTTWSKYDGMLSTTNGYWNVDAPIAGYYSLPRPARTVSHMSRIGTQNTIKDYCGIWEGNLRSMASGYKAVLKAKMGDRLEVGKTYTISFKYTASISNDAGAGISDNNGNKKAAEFALESSIGIDASTFKVNGKPVAKSGTRILSAIGYNTTDQWMGETVWEQVSYTFKVTKKPSNTDEWFIIRSWWGSTVHIAEMKLEEGEQVTEYLTDRRDEADNQGQMGDLGYRPQAPNYGQYYNEELKIYASYKVNDLVKPKMMSYFPETGQFMVELEIEVFNLITNAQEHLPNTTDASSGLTRANTCSRFEKDFFNDKTGQGAYKGVVNYTLGKGGTIFIPYFKDKIGVAMDNAQNQTYPYYETNGKPMIYKTGGDSIPDQEIDFTKETLYSGNMVQITDRN